MLNHGHPRAGQRAVYLLGILCCAAVLIRAAPTTAFETEPYLGSIEMWAGTFAPRGWAFCSGQLLPVNQNPALYSLLGTTYGGDGRTTFGLPDLRGRVPVGMSDTIALGQTGGSESVTLQSQETPVQVTTATLPATAFSDTGTARAIVTDTTGTQPIQAVNIGEGEAHENRQPYLTVNYIIAIMGTYPPRN